MTLLCFLCFHRPKRHFAQQTVQGTALINKAHIVAEGERDGDENGDEATLSLTDM